MTERLDQTLAALSAFLTSEGDVVRAKHVEQTRMKLKASSQGACVHLASNAYWGGPGAIWETVYSADWQPPECEASLREQLRNRTDDEVAAANRKLNALVSALADEFSIVCKDCVDSSWIERASYLGEIQKELLNKGIR